MTRWHWVLVTGLLAAPLPVEAQPVKAGPEFQLNTYTTDSQQDPTVASLPGGAFVVVWDSAAYAYIGQDGSGVGVFGRRYNSNGVAVGAEFQVNTYTMNYQYRSKVAAASSGAFVVVWEGSHDGGAYGVFGQRYDSLGATAGTEFQINTYTTGNQGFPAVAVAPGGDFVVVWQSVAQDGFTYGVFGRRYNSSGTAVGGEFQVNTYTSGAQREPAAAYDASGNLAVVWSSQNDGDLFGIFGQRYDSSGSAVGTEFQVNSYTTDNQSYARVAHDGSGGFLVVWQGFVQDGSSLGVFGRRYDSLGAAAGTEFQINTYTTNRQENAALTADPAGGFVVVWQSNTQDGDRYGIFGKRLDSTGASIGTEFQVNTYTTQYQSFPAVASTGADNFVVVWTSKSDQDGANSGAFGQRFAPPTMTPTLAPPTPTSTPTPMCAATPISGCRTPTKSLLILKQLSPDTKDKLVWKWIKGQSTTQAEFGNPVTTTKYALCVYDGAGLVTSVDVPPAGTCGTMPCWAGVSTKGYRYKDKTGANQGVVKVLLKGSTNNTSKTLVIGKGLNLPDPVSVQLTGTVTAQLVNSTSGVCFQSSFSGGQIIRNDPDFFKAKVVP